MKVWEVKAKLTDYSTVTRNVEAPSSRGAIVKFLHVAVKELTENRIAEIKRIEVEEIDREEIV